ncbi:MAG TPA: DUF3300 domain-containing protein [Casimicrobiaceae bacterium]|jgi:hypothetical protein|nr:DUF3300 domain-containing protein [Casimicrobiaceae bacterium]
MGVAPKLSSLAPRRVRCALIGALAALLVAVTPVGAQSAAAPSYSQDELDQLLAPIALYPDQLLMQILIAATYPLEVVAAARFVQENPDLRDDALDQAVAAKNWDPSLQSLAAYPQVLAMMNDSLEWMQRLGDAFLADQARVMDTVQSLRQKALTAGNLQSTPELSVMPQDGDIAIDTAQPDSVYVPVYNPFLIYGPWWAPAYPPLFWCPPPVYGYPFCPVNTIGIIFGAPWPIWYNHWGWAQPYWHGRRITINTSNNRFWSQARDPRMGPDGTWEHSPSQRRGVAYPDAATRDRYTSIDPSAVRSRQDFRAYDRVPAAQNGVPRAPTATVHAPPFDPMYSRQQTQIDAQRGIQSRQSIPMAPAPGFQAPVGRAPAPAPGRAPQGGTGRR